MTNLIIQGIGGRMGHALLEKIAARDDCRVVAGVDQKAGDVNGIPVYASVNDLPADGVLIDFTSPAGAVAAAEYGAGHGIPCVICSTGLSKEQEARLEAASEKVAIFRSANMSVGINVLIELCKRAVTLFDGEFDIEIVEKHHHNKLDAPSGTAITLAGDILDRIDRKTHWTSGTTTEPDALEIASVRRSVVPGIHTVTYESEADVLSITHCAKNRCGFATGAVMAAEFVAGKKGIFSMKDLLGLE